MIRQSFSWWCFAGRGIEDEELLSAAKEIGYEAVELLPDHKLSLAAKHGLTIASHGAHPLGQIGLNNPAFHDEIEESILAHIELAVQYGIENLIVFSGERSPEISDEQGMSNTVLALKRVIKQAEDANIRLVMELLNSKVDHARYQCDSTEWGIAVCEQLGSTHFGLLYDIYHMQIMEGDLIRTIRDHHKHFFHYHTAGNPGRRNLDDSQEIFYPSVVRAIAETGYSGLIGHEFIPKKEVIPALREAYDICNF